MKKWLETLETLLLKKFKLRGFKKAIAENNFKSPPAKKPTSHKTYETTKVIIKDKRAFKKTLMLEEKMDSRIFINIPKINI